MVSNNVRWTQMGSSPSDGRPLTMSDISGRPADFALPAFRPELLADSRRLGSARTNWWVDICPQGQWVSAPVHFRCTGSCPGYWGVLVGRTGGTEGCCWVLAGRRRWWWADPGRSQIQAQLCSIPGPIFFCNAAVVVVQDGIGEECAVGGGNWNGNSIVRSPRPTGLDQPFQHAPEYFRPSISFSIRFVISF